MKAKQKYVRCPACCGTGKIYAVECDYCAGSGQVSEQERDVYYRTVSKPYSPLPDVKDGRR